MRWNQTGLSNGSQQTSVKVLPKPIEMYVFIDPLCPECWSLNPYLKKLTLEYGRFFTLIPIISSVFVSSSKKAQKEHLLFRSERREVQKTDSRYVPMDRSLGSKGSRNPREKGRENFPAQTAAKIILASCGRYGGKQVIRNRERGQIGRGGI